MGQERVWYIEWQQYTPTPKPRMMRPMMSCARTGAVAVRMAPMQKQAPPIVMVLMRPNDLRCQHNLCLILGQNKGQLSHKKYMIRGQSTFCHQNDT